MDQRRAIWHLMQAGLDPRKLVFLDETWAKTNMTRPRKTTTFLAGLRLSGLSAPLVIDGTVNGAVFVNYVQQHLAPTLSAGDILIMDNLNSHK